eukprot:3840757-Pleurochrysis_carterae.AAC.5
MCACVQLSPHEVAAAVVLAFAGWTGSLESVVLRRDGTLGWRSWCDCAVRKSVFTQRRLESVVQKKRIFLTFGVTLWCTRCIAGATDMLRARAVGLALRLHGLSNRAPHRGGQRARARHSAKDALNK